MSDADEFGDLLRELAPQALAVLLRRYGGFDACEDAVQEALLAATVQWRDDGMPDNPRAWLVTVASRRLVDQVRSEQARRRREQAVATNEPADADLVPAAGETGAGDGDDTLRLLFLCCHPALTPASQVALTLRAVGGLTTAEIAQAFLVPEATMAPRISRAKQSIRAAGARFELPDEAQYAERLAVVLHVLYLIFNEGYTASSGTELHRTDLTAEAIRLARQVHRALPDDGEVAGLIALMLLTDARRPARTDDSGDLVPLAEQDRGRWDKAMIEEGDRLVTDAMLRSPLGPYQLQAAIASLHVTAPRAEDTDWEQIRILYGVLARLTPNPMVTVNHAVAVGMAKGPQAGLDLLATQDDDRRIAGHHRLLAVRAHLLELAGDTDTARETYLQAARRTTSLPEQRHLQKRAARLTDGDCPDQRRRMVAAMSGYRRVRVPVADGELTVGVWGAGESTVLAIHGVTSSHLAWSMVGERLPAGVTLAAVDLRGRGGSAELPGPYGMATHADDCIAVLDALDVPSAVVVGHSMGGFVALVVADQYPGRVQRLVLVDGGPPLPLPAGVTPEEQLESVIGPAAARLRMRFADRAAYRDYWRAHPALRDWTPAVEAYVDYDLTGEEPNLRSRVSERAVHDDSVDLYTGEALASAWQRLRHPAVFLRAERGLADQPVPLYPDTDVIAARLPVRTVPDTNHYTILFDETAAAEVAAALASDT